MGVDALAGEYAAFSPYCYVGGNPVRMVDPGGKDASNSLYLTFSQKKDDDISESHNKRKFQKSWQPQQSSSGDLQLKQEAGDNAQSLWEWLGKDENFSWCRKFVALGGG